MSKGRSTTVVSIRLPDEVVRRLKALARQRRQTMTELLKPVIGKFAINERVGGVSQHSSKVERKPLQRELSPTPESFTKVGRNDPCPCGSGKKYKKCHGV